MEIRRINGIMILFTLIGGILGAIVGEVILSNINGSFPRCILMGLYFGILALFISLSCYIAEIINPVLNGHVWKNGYSRTSLKYLALTSFIMIFCASTILQFIYGINFTSKKNIDDIILLIDISESMMNNDPLNERFDAVNNLVNEMNRDNRVAVFVFNGNPALINDMTYVDQNLKKSINDKLQLYKIPTGDTNIKEALNKASDQINEMEKKDRSAMVILLTDGVDSYGLKDNIDGVIKPYKDLNVPINTIGMFQGDYLTLQEISEKTNGKYYNLEDINDLKSLFDKIYDPKAKRILVSERTGDQAHNIIFSIMRILFLGFIGTLIGLGLGLMFDNKNISKAYGVSGAISGIISGLILEIGFLCVPSLGTQYRFIADCLLAIVFSLTPITIKILSDEGNQYYTKDVNENNIDSQMLNKKVFK